MKFKPGDILSLIHYSALNPMLTSVVKAEADILQLKKDKDLAALNISAGDPVVLVGKIERNVYICEGTLAGINERLELLSVKHEELRLVSDKRSIDRVSTSLYSLVNPKNPSKTIVALIKNISPEGVAFISKEDFAENTEVDLEIYVNSTALPIRVKINRKAQNIHNFEYGSRIMHPDEESKNAVSIYFNFLKKEHEKIVGF